MEGVIDIALALESLVPAAVYGGSVTAGTEAAWDAVTWLDERAKPTWAELVAAAPDPVKLAQAAMAAQIAQAVEAALEDLGREYCRTERDTWNQQYAEAQAYQADSSASVPLLDAIATARGQSVADLAAAIVANRAAWVVLAGSVVGQRLALQDQVDAAATVAEIQAITVAISLPE